MPSKIVLIAAFAAFAASYGQAQTASQSTSTPGPFGGPILVTPTATLPNPQPTAGISDAGRAGISVSAPATVGPSGLPAESNTAATTAGTEVGSAAAAASAEEARTGDLSSSTFVGETTTATAAAGMSVAEASDRFKSAKGTRNARTLTNDDVEKMLGGRTGVTMARNMPPLGPGIPVPSADSTTTASMTSASQNASAQNQASPAGTAPNTTGSATQNAAAGSQQAQSGATSQSRQGQTAETPASAENATTPQINQRQQANDAAGSTRLPATSTFLPLLGLLGLVGGGIGLWLRKSSR